MIGVIVAISAIAVGSFFGAVLAVCDIDEEGE